MGPVVTLVLGLAALILGAELLVRGGSQLARRLGIPPMVVGLTVVSIGTSLPELAVGISASLEGAGSLAVGNIAGTNLVNLLLILGLSATIRPLALKTQTFKLDLPAMAVAALALVLLSLDGDLSRGDGVLLVGLAVVYTVVVVRVGLRASAEARTSAAARTGAGGGGQGDGAEDGKEGGARSVAVDVVMLLGGIVIVIVGAEWLVAGAVTVARNLGIPEAVIGLTVVAIGTSAPELVTTIVSTIRKDRDIAIGNLIGSSFYNIALILGVTAVVSPMSMNETLVRVDLPLMAGVMAVCFLVFFTGRRVTRAEGVVFVVGYLVYLTYLLVART